MIWQFRSRCIPKRMESRDSNRYLYTCVHCYSLNTLCSFFEEPTGENRQMSINRWMDKQNWSIYIMEYNSAIKRNKVLKHAIAKSILKTCCVKEAFLPFSFSFSFSPFAGGPSHYIYGSPGHIQGPLVGVPTDSSISHQTCKRNKD